MQDKSRNIVIGGGAGQGLVTVGTLLARLLVRCGYHIVTTQGYESRIRGGHNTFEIRASADRIDASKETIDLLVALDANTISVHRDELSQTSVTVADAALTNEMPRSMGVPFKDLGPAKTENVAAFGVVLFLLGLKQEVATDVIREAFGKKDPKIAQDNERVLQSALKWAGSQPVTFQKLPAINDLPARLMMNGNDAIALGAISSGLKFYSFYPMSPSTSISLALAAHSKNMGIVVEQAEDEISAINMAIGASFAGAPAMVASSGGGFALMVEGVSLAAMTETPIVIVLAQRPAPATGLPTRTEQGDLEFALHSGHGEFPRAMFAPGGVEECFHLTRLAFELAEKYQGPVFVLTDQFLADSDRAVERFDLDSLKPIRVGSAPSDVKLPYRRYAFTDNGISPRLLPGASENLVIADSDEHTEDGHLTEDLSIRKLMVEKRMRKMIGITSEVVPPSISGDDRPDLLLVCWGSTKGSTGEAAEILRSQGRRVACMHFSQVWPLDPGQFAGRLKGASEVAVVEGNATAQFSRLIRRETGFDIKKRVLRYDGLPITPGYIIRELGY